MERREFIKYAGLGVLPALFHSVGSTFGKYEVKKRPNILFITTDQQHAGMLSCAGNKDLKTPAMDKLAASGIRFERAYATNPVCVPSRFSLQTGLMPSIVGGYENSSTMKANVPENMTFNSLGPLFHRAGYDCVYGGKVHLPSTLWNSAAKDGWKYICKDERDKLAEVCSDYLKKPHDKPFFMFVSLINPHDICYMAINRTLKENPRGPEPFKKLQQEALKHKEDLKTFVAKHCPELPDNYDVPEKEPEAVRSKYLEVRKFRLHVRQHWDENMWRIHRWMYARLTEKVDGQVGRVLDALKQSDHADNTLVIFTSDHGDHDSAHRLEHKSIPYEEAARVPFFMSYPGIIPAGIVNDKHLISNGLDLLPTLCDYARIETPTNLPGLSLRALAEGKNVKTWREFVVSESESARMIRTDSFKYMVFDSGANREFLIDLKNDPGEMHNIADDRKYKDQLNHLRKLLCDWVNEVNDEIGKKYVISPI
ncbi:MAG: sulfatase family protein [Planctomycetota bacterium]